MIDGPITRLAFEAYSETQLKPTLRTGDVVILCWSGFLRRDDPMRQDGGIRIFALCMRTHMR